MTPPQPPLVASLVLANAALASAERGALAPEAAADRVADLMTPFAASAPPDVRRILERARAVVAESLKHAPIQRHTSAPAPAPAPTRPAAPPRTATPARAGAEGDEGEAAVLRMAAEFEASLVTPGETAAMDAIVGLDDIKATLVASIEGPYVNADYYRDHRPTTAVLLYGPPGTGKTAFARAVAQRMRLPLLGVSAADIAQKWVGESPKRVKAMFLVARRTPCVLFIDEIDALFPKAADDGGGSVATAHATSQFLRDYAGSADSLDGSFLIAATNLPHAMDDRVVRRFGLAVEVPLPDAAARRGIFAVALGRTRVAVADAEWDEIVADTAGFSGADIARLVTVARDAPMKRALALRAGDAVPGYTDAAGRVVLDEFIGGAAAAREGLAACAEPVPGDDVPRLLAPPIFTVEAYRAARREVAPTVTAESLAAIARFQRQRA